MKNWTIKIVCLFVVVIGCLYLIKHKNKLYYTIQTPYSIIVVRRGKRRRTLIHAPWYMRDIFWITWYTSRNAFGYRKSIIIIIIIMGYEISFYLFLCGRGEHWCWWSSYCLCFMTMEIWSIYVFCLYIRYISFGSF